MWISKKRYESLEKRVADLEKKIQSQQMEVNPSDVSKYHPELPLKQVFRNVLEDAHTAEFRVDLSNRRLFELLIEQKQ